MRILVHDHSAHPFQFGLSAELACRGHNVLHATADARSQRFSDQSGVTARLAVTTISAGRVRMGSVASRWVYGVRYAQAFTDLCEKWQPEAILSGNAPVHAQLRGARWARERKIAFVYWVQDLMSVAAATLLKPRLGVLAPPAVALVAKTERRALAASAHAITISEEFAETLVSWGVPANKITTIANWAPVEDIPVLPRDNQFSQRHGLAGKWVALYAGTLGMKHDPRLLADTAEAIQDDTDVLLVVAAEGAGANRLRADVERRGLANVLCLPIQPFSVFPSLLASCNTTLTMLSPAASTFCVPSKVWSAYCAGRPSVLAIPKENQAARVTTMVGAGIVVDPPSADVIADTLRYLKANPAEAASMGRRAREFAESSFSITRIASVFEETLLRAVDSLC